jgi:cytidine diphosphoramidate kinase
MVRLGGAGSVIWITGLSGAGKSTLAREVARRLRGKDRAVVMLDGDELRDIFGASGSNGTHYGRDGRLALAFRYAQLCRVIADQGLIVAIATISLFKEVHTWNRANLPGYFEVFLNVPIDELRRRDSKGIYRSFDSGGLTDVAGLDMLVDEPEAPDWIVEYAAERSVEAMANELIGRFFEKNERA